MATILVVDDEPDVLLLARIVLEHAGHDVETAADGRQALAIIEVSRPDAIVLDVMMPELDGWSVLAALKGRGAAGRATAGVPVVVLSALTAPVDVARGGIEGAVSFLSKPFDPDDLVEAVRQAIEGPPEAEQRRRAQTRGLEDLARIEKGIEKGSATEAGLDAHRPHLTALERPPEPGPRVAVRDSETAGQHRDLAAGIRELTPNQRQVLAAVRRTPTVLAAARALDVSRSNVYAGLRRIARRLGVADASELVELIRRSDAFADLD